MARVRQTARKSTSVANVWSERISYLRANRDRFWSRCLALEDQLFAARSRLQRIEALCAGPLVSVPQGSTTPARHEAHRVTYRGSSRDTSRVTGRKASEGASKSAGYSGPPTQPAAGAVQVEFAARRKTTSAFIYQVAAFRFWRQQEDGARQLMEYVGPRMVIYNN